MIDVQPYEGAYKAFIFVVDEDRFVYLMEDVGVCNDRQAKEKLRSPEKRSHISRWFSWRPDATTLWMPDLMMSGWAGIGRMVLIYPWHC
jgi:hypothetical protein